MGKCNKDGILWETNFASACVLFSLLHARSEVTMERWMNEERDSMPPPLPPLGAESTSNGGACCCKADIHAASVWMRAAGRIPCRTALDLKLRNCKQTGPHSEHRFLAPSSKLCQPELVTPLNSAVHQRGRSALRKVWVMTVEAT